MTKLFVAAFAALLSAKAAFAIECSASSQCPESSPCCSAYGTCGVGLYCLQGCDPLSSFSLDSCTPEAVCADVSTTFDSVDKVKSQYAYLGDASTTDWVYEGAVEQGDGALLITMNKTYTSTVISSTHYIWYGKMEVKMKTARTQGVITTFILMSDVHDEIDYEWVGADLETAQSNYYWQGITDYTHSGNGTIDSDSFENYHTYTIDWQEEQTTWAIDGTIFRTLKKSDTFNATSGDYKYPQTPSRMQMSVWAAGLEDSAPGTVAWAGGYINWDSQDITDKGYFYATLAEASISCYDAPSAANSTGNVSYVYADNSGMNSSVSITDKDTTLNNFDNSYLNATAGAAATSGAVATATSGATATTGASNAGSGSGTSSGTSSSSSSSSSGGFSQGSSGTSSGATSIKGEGALFAIVIAMVALVMM